MLKKITKVHADTVRKAYDRTDEIQRQLQASVNRNLKRNQKKKKGGNNGAQGNENGQSRPRGITLIKTKQVEERSRGMLYISCGILVVNCLFASMISWIEGWDALTGAYFSVVTITTVGYGDVHPETSSGRVLTAVYIIYGVVLITWSITFLAEYIANNLEELTNGDGDEESEQDATSDKKTKKKKSEKGSTWRMVAIAVARVVVVFSIGMAYCMLVDELSLAESFYFAVVSSTTVGYGDVTLEGSEGKLFSIFYIFIGCFVVAKAVGAGIDAVIESRRRALQRKILEQQLSRGELAEADADLSGELTEAEFVLFKLQRMGLVDPDQLQQIKEHFYELDVDGSGAISQEEAMRLLSNNTT